ncbi:TPA: hypothetical protein DCW38_08055 [candidate division WOR-3 bacterium]|jgi:NADH:ubiquinone oxidoreductase subunit C|uniref:NADH:ubiquinone oxidoreductase 30kDa subunit domain-containing protein n=1 Tax=candidate division WOR-3 bacterium TaxID=2052148 RepID=A0A350HC49_UNCW3|nr:hypothetical protein [candidate division WOR-3 bacterium]
MNDKYYEIGFLTHDIRMVTGADVNYNSSSRYVNISTKRESLTFLLDFLYTKWGFNYLLLMNCINEEKGFTLQYILSSRKILYPIIVRIFLPKDAPVFTTVGMIHKSAYQYEADIYKKHKIVFEGNNDTLSYYVKNVFGGEIENE